MRILRFLGTGIVGLALMAIGSTPQFTSARDAVFQMAANVTSNTPAQSAVPIAAAPPDCSLVVPANPLTAAGLATPYQLFGTGANTNNCHESDPNFAAFVQAAALDPATGAVSVYDPLVVDRGTSALIPPTTPRLPAGAVVGIWFGFNGNSLALTGPGARHCVTGLRGSRFGQVSFCNADAFFDAATTAISRHQLTPPTLGTAKDGKPCPTVRDFSVVDQDQSDNVTTTYLVTANGQTAQNIPQNAAQLKGAGAATNGSDNRLLDAALDSALGCTPWAVTDLADPSGQSKATAQPLNELQASVRQAPPIALVPAMDPMVLVNGQPNLSKLNRYRVGVDQPTAASLAAAGNTDYCKNLLTVGLPRILADKPLTITGGSPMPTAASNLFNFLAMRFQNTFSDQAGFLFCQTALNVQNPVTLTTDANGVVVDAQINLHPGKPQPSPAPSGPAQSPTPTPSGMTTPTPSGVPTPSPTPTACKPV